MKILLLLIPLTFAENILWNRSVESREIDHSAAAARSRVEAEISREVSRLVRDCMDEKGFHQISKRPIICRPHGIKKFECTGEAAVRCLSDQ